MRTTVRLVSFLLLAATGVLLAGCPDKDPQPTTPAGTASASASTAPADTAAGSSGSGW